MVVLMSYVEKKVVHCGLWLFTHFHWGGCDDH